MRCKKNPSDHCFRYAPEKIPGLIESSDSDLRNQAGETIAVLYEIARDINSVSRTRGKGHSIDRF